VEIETARARFLVAASATALIFGAGVATAVVTSGDGFHPMGGNVPELEVTETNGPTSGPSTTTSTTFEEPTSDTDSTPDSTIVTTGTTGTTPNGTSGVTATGTGDTAAAADAPLPELECDGQDPRNHGEYVSSQPENGEARRDAAHSDCGKPPSSAGNGAGEPHEQPDTPHGGAHDPGDSSPGNGHSNGNGNAYGHSRK
jgi:hypothetical protein